MSPFEPRIVEICLKICLSGYPVIRSGHETSRLEPKARALHEEVSSRLEPCMKKSRAPARARLVFAVMILHQMADISRCG